MKFDGFQGMTILVAVVAKMRSDMPLKLSNMAFGHCGWQWRLRSWQKWMPSQGYSNRNSIWVHCKRSPKNVRSSKRRESPYLYPSKDINITSVYDYMWFWPPEGTRKYVQFCTLQKTIWALRFCEKSLVHRRLSAFMYVLWKLQNHQALKREVLLSR